MPLFLNLQHSRSQPIIAQIFATRTWQSITILESSMTLIDIDKTRYRKQLNLVIGGFIISFALLALLFGQLLIMTFSDGVGSNFRLNLAGVIVALVACGLIINHFKNNAFFYEIYYIWQLKQLLNKIYRVLNKLKLAARQDDVTALIILNYYYAGLEKLYLLDDNTLTLSSVRSNQTALNEQLTAKQLAITVADFDHRMLAQFK